MRTEGFNDDTYVALSSDSNYYRCKVEQVQQDDMVLVRWIDYGNCETISRASLKELDEKFKAPISILARKMFVPLKFLADGFTIVNMDWSEYVLKVNILGIHQKYFVCDLSQNGVSVFSQPQQEGKVQWLDIKQLEELLEAFERERNTEKRVEKEAIEIPMEKSEEPLQAENHAVQTTQAEIHAEQPTPQTVEEVTEEVSEMVIEINDSIEMQVDTSNTQKAEPVVTTNRELAFISHVDSPNRFYIQLNSDSDTLFKLQESLQIVAPQLPPLTGFRAGQLCNGFYSYDEQWYRAKIIDTDGDITSIQFVDYGNTDSITNNAFLKSADETLNSRGPLAMPCSLPIKPRGSIEWADSACNKLRMLTVDDSPLEFEIISQDKDVNYVKLFFVGGRDLIKELIQEGVADPVEIIKSGETCYVSHINSLSDFFIQVESDTDALHKIELYLKNNSDSVVMDSAAAGTICSAQFEDGDFYRARIINVLPDSQGYEVEFLDYGNTFKTTEVRSMNPEIVQIPHLRKRCSLKMPDDLQNWSDEAEQQFRKIANEGATGFTVHLVKPGKKACVELFLDGENQSDVLSKLCERRQMSPIVVDEQEIIPETVSLIQHPIHVNGFPSGKQSCAISYINTPDDFFIQFVAKTDDLNMIGNELAKLNEYEDIDQNDVSVGSIVAALYPEDGNFYRAKVIEKTPSKVLVYFIDYGNQCVTPKLRKLPDLLGPIIPLAINCTLTREKLHQFNATDRAFFPTLVDLDDPAEPTFQVEAINTAPPKVTVELYRNDTEILQMIREMKGSTAVVGNFLLSNIIEEACLTGSNQNLKQ